MNINTISMNTVTTHMQLNQSNFKGKQQYGKIITRPNVQSNFKNLQSKLSNLNEDGRSAVAFGGYALAATILSPLLFMATPFITVPLVVGGLVVTIPSVTNWVDSGKFGKYFNGSNKNNCVSNHSTHHRTHYNSKHIRHHK